MPRKSPPSSPPQSSPPAALPAASSLVRIVLVEPRNPLNILAAARAARNFGWEDIAVVHPHPPIWKRTLAAKGAKKWLGKARLFPDMASAIEDRNWVLGTSTLAGRSLDEPNRFVPLEDFAAKIRRRKRTMRAAILFGAENHGLSNEMLDYCHHLLRIPTVDELPSMNLGQAVALCCYEMRRQFLGVTPSTPANPPAASGEVLRLVDGFASLLPELSAAPGDRMPRRRTLLRQLLLRLPLTSQDVTFLLGLVRDTSWEMRHGKQSPAQSDSPAQHDSMGNKPD